MTVSRRTFIVGCSAAIAAMTGGAVRGLAFAQPGDTTRRDILVVVFLRGGYDGEEQRCQHYRSSPMFTPQ
jgi:uncharacterized protein (DUF1501 family)